MFRKLAKAESGVTFFIEGRPFQAVAGENLAGALLRCGFSTFRTTPISGAPRAAYCLMGVCYECLAEIDGVPNRQTCMATVCGGMRIEVQRGAVDAHALHKDVA